MTVGLGNLVAAQFDQVWKPRTVRGSSKYGVILAHGAFANEFDMATWPETMQLAAVLANEGIPCIGGQMGGNSWGNDAISGTSVNSYMNKALAYLSAQTGCSASKAHVIGVSMGAGVGNRWAALNPTKCASLQGLMPLSSMEHVYTDNPGVNVAAGASFSESIATAWGLAFRSVSNAVINGTTTLTSASGAFTGADVGRQIIRGYTQTGIPVNTKIVSVTNSTTVVLDKTCGSGSGQIIGICDPFPMAASSAGADLIGYYAPLLASNSIPNRWFYSDDDPLIYPADVEAVAAAAGGPALKMTTGLHARPLLQNVAAYGGGSSFSNIVDYVVSYGA